MKKINLLHVITGLGMGGAERVVLDLASASDKKKFNIKVVSLSKRIELLDDFRKQNIDTNVLYKNSDLISMIEMIKFVNKFVKENNIEIIHAHMTHAAIVASMVKLFNPGVKVVFTSHSSNVGSRAREFFLFCLKPLRNIDIVFSKDILKFFYKKNYKIVPNGIKLENYNLKVKKNKKFTFITIGRLETVKNHQYLIEIANRLKNEFDFELQIVGDGYLKNDLLALIKKYKLEDTVKLLGLRNDIPILLNQSHCFLMPSLWEGLPIVLLESAASRIPIIATPVGSIPSFLTENDGYLTHLNNFEHTMTSVFENYQVAENKAEHLYQKLKLNYSIDSIVMMHEKIYNKVLE